MVYGKQITGPGIVEQTGEVEITIPECVKLTTQKDIDEFRDFVAEIIKKARTAFEAERAKQ